MLLPEPIPERAQRAHTRFHGRHPIASCWHCQRDYARCLSKVTYHTREAVDLVVTDINETRDYREPVMRYPCTWSGQTPHWHVRHARSGRDHRRARRAWRRWRASLGVDRAR